MLSPGEWWKKVPKEKVENLKFRRWLLLKCRGNKLNQRAMVECCRRDLLFFCNSFVWTFDPRTRGKSLPFITWPVQDRAFMTILECIEEGRDLVIEKSRDMGASWMSITAMEWLWHFHPGNSFLMVSRKEGLVDAPGDPDSLFWKVDFIHRHLPGWLRPETDRRKLHFGNMENGSTIDGESTTAAAGVGGRRTAMFIDEFSRIEEGSYLLAGTADTTNCRIFNFTPFGTNNAAYRLARRTDVRKLRLHWQDHPEKAAGLYRYSESLGRVEVIDKGYVFPLDYTFVLDGKMRSPWYDGECRRRDNPREVAQMIDIDYQGSEYQFFDKAMILDLQRHYAVEPYWEGDVSFDPDTGRPRGLIKCHGGPLKLWTTLNVDGNPAAAPYAGGADLAVGSGCTNSCFTVVDCRTGEKVLEYASPFLRPEQMAPRVVALCWIFKDEKDEPVKMAWEQQGPGTVFGKAVMELGFRNVYYRVNEFKICARPDNEQPGWFPSPDNKRLLLEDYRTALSSRQFLNRSHVALEECLFFIHTNKGVEHSEEKGSDDPTGARDNHGDRVIADALAWKMAKGSGYQKKTEKAKGPAVLSLAWRREWHERHAQLEEAAW